MIMRYGTSGPEVVELQRLLLATGYDPGPLDGSFGRTTFSALVKFRFAANKPVDAAGRSACYSKLVHHDDIDTLIVESSKRAPT